ncbi:MAG TPA: hypothetical protein PK514_13175 [Spirochaetota bacterium]|nr:hypothetical protein [Spirochaetota bacterium]
MRTQDTGGQAAVTAAVMLSAIAALCEYLFAVIIMPVQAVMGLALLSFVFDVVFTAVFISDAAEAARRHKIRSFMLHGRGIVDFCGSVPVLLFFSVPSVIIIASGTESAGVNFMKTMTFFWSSLCITGLLRVSRMTRLASLPLFSGSGMTERHITLICTVICGAAVTTGPVCGFIMRRAGAQYAHAAAGAIAAFMLFIILSAVIAIYSRHFGNTVSSVLDTLDKGFRRREFYLKVKLREEFRDDGIYRIAAFYNETYLPAKTKQNINSPEPAAYRVPEEEVKNFIRNR